MKFLLILSMLVVTSFSKPLVRTWTLHELSNAIGAQGVQDQAMQPYLVDALNQIMYALFTAQDKGVLALLLSPTGSKAWTKEQLKKAIDDPGTNPTFQPFLRGALQQLSYLDDEEKNQDSVEVAVPALDISVWTVDDVTEAKDDPSTKSPLLFYLKNAEEKIKDALEKGERKKDIRVTLVTPVGLLPNKNGSSLQLVSRTAFSR